MSNVNLETQRLHIKPLIPDDARSFFSYRSLDEVTRFQMFKPGNLTDAINFINSTSVELNVPDSWYQLGLFERDGNKHIGDIGIHFLKNVYETEIGCTIAPKYWRKGYATEGLKAVIPFLFNTLRKKRIIARISIDNTGSRILFECMGFQLISQNDGEAIYQLIKTD
jgi:RimJ/RimL family protein N-acetyltransferase